MALSDSRKVVVAAKYGATVVGATDGVPISNEDVRLSPKTATGSYKCINGKKGNKTTWVNTDDVTVEGATIESLLIGNDTTGLALATPPAWDNLYQICGLDKTVATGVSVTYTPTQLQPSALSQVAVWRDGNKRILTGVIGTLVIDGTIGEPIKQTVTVSGFTTITSTAEANPAVTCVNEALLLVLKSTDSITFTGTAYKGQKFTLTQGNAIAKEYFIGVKDFSLNDFESSLSVTYLKENENIYADFAAGTTHNVVIKAGTVNGKSVKITCAQALVEEITESSINMKEAVTVKFNLKGDGTGINQFAILFGTTA